MLVFALCAVCYVSFVVIVILCYDMCSVGVVLYEVTMLFVGG